MTKELTHALEIIQNKLKACQQEQRHKLNKMTTKRSLLGESIEVLQNTLGSSLKQDVSRKYCSSHTTINKGQQRWTPIIGSPFDTKEEAENTTREKLKIIKCQGWIKHQRIWIQAQVLCLSNDIDQAHLSSIPNIVETIDVNKIYAFKENTIYEFYMTLDLPDDIVDLSDLKVACQVDGRSLSSLSSIEWINGSNDLSWKEQILSISSSSPSVNVIQAYFPCHIQIACHKDNDTIMASLLPDLIKLNDHLYLSKDQMYIFDYRDNEEEIHLYGLTNRAIATIASQFPHLSLTTHTATNKELIKSLGDQCVTLEHNHLNNTRLQTSLLLSDMTK